MSDNEKLISKLFDPSVEKEIKRRALADCEADGTLEDLIRKHHPGYILPDGSVMKFKILRDVGIPY